LFFQKKKLVLKVWQILSNVFRIYTQKIISMYPHSAKIWWAGGAGQKNKYQKTDPKQGLNQGY
jgi:hypothetical protein